ncbi:MAG TPA: hypothetical protein VI199_09765 [Novosphingobium sp.]
MADSTNNSDRILAEARNSLVTQREGGRRVAESHSIGHRSRQLKQRHLVGRIWRMMLGVAGVIVVAMAAGLVIGGIGFTGLFLTALSAVLVAALLLNYPRLKVPTRAQLAQGSIRTIVGNTELWLESQRRALPAPAVQVVDQIGLQLDALGLQLDRVGEDQPGTEEIRQLVGEYLPDLVSTYTAIPAHLRSQPGAGGASPDQALTASLGKISGEIDAVTRQLAAGSIDSLAIKARYLDYKYGAALEDRSAKPE